MRPTEFRMYAVIDGVRRLIRVLGDGVEIVGVDIGNVDEPIGNVLVKRVYGPERFRVYVAAEPEIRGRAPAPEGTEWIERSPSDGVSSVGGRDVWGFMCGLRYANGDSVWLAGDGLGTDSEFPEAFDTASVAALVDEARRLGKL